MEVCRSDRETRRTALNSDVMQRAMDGLFQGFANASDQFHSRLDVAALNLCCALGLPGADNLDIDKRRAQVDAMARHVLLETERHYYRFLNDPADYEDSQGYFCILILITVLQQDCGVRYNPARVRDPKFQDPDCFDPDFSDSRDLFIHGILDGPGGTCVSMPVLMVAVGRRLGYPLRLVEAPGHLFARWDDPEGKFNGVPDRFNIDCSGRGFACHSDDHYKAWPRTWMKHEEDSGCYLKSLTPREEIAVFMASRGHCLWDNGRLGDAIRAYCMTTIFAPCDPRYGWQLCDAYRKYRVEILKRAPDEAAKVSLTIEEQLELQKAIVNGHVCRLRSGKPGLNLVDFGIQETITYGNAAARSRFGVGQIRPAEFANPVPGCFESLQGQGALLIQHSQRITSQDGVISLLAAHPTASNETHGGAYRFERANHR